MVEVNLAENNFSKAQPPGMGNWAEGKFLNLSTTIV